MTCAHCNIADASISLQVDGVDYELCDDCAERFTHPSYDPETIVKRLADMSKRHQRTEELTSH